MKENMGNKEVFNRNEAARFLGVSVSYIERLMREKRIPYSKINGRVFFLKKDLIKWIEKKRVVKPNNDI